MADASFTLSLSPLSTFLLQDLLIDQLAINNQPYKKSKYAFKIRRPYTNRDRF